MENKDELSHLRCYWTRPFGHIWKEGQTSYERNCVLCNQDSIKGNYDGGWHYDLDVHYDELTGGQKARTLTEKHQARALRALDKKKKKN